MKNAFKLLASALAAAGLLAACGGGNGPDISPVKPKVTAVKVMDGQFDHYMTHLQGPYKRVMEAQKEAGIILDYAVYSTQARRPDEPDLYLTVVYPNMAAFDGLRDRSEAVSSKVTGQSTTQANAAYADRGKMRQILGSNLIRQLKLK